MFFNFHSVRTLAVVLLAMFSTTILVGCKGTLHNQLGLVKDESSGLMFGSRVERNIIVDSSFFRNKKIKIRTRNTSGDLAFDLSSFNRRIANDFVEKGYDPVSSTSDDFGLLLDINVMYSGHIETSAVNEFAFLGAAVGAVRGAKSSSDYGRVTGPVGGAALGAVIGANITEDTYIIVSRITFSEIKGGKKKTGKTITFSRSFDPKWDEEEREEKEERRSTRGVKKLYASGVAAYGGGANTSQSEIAKQVRERIVRILSNII